MCGIAGVYHFDEKPLDLHKLNQFSDILKHRGPDDKGFLTYDTNNKSLVRSRNAENLPQGNLGLMHRRLSIMDLEETGWQPMMSSDETIAVVYNGEIYNFVEIAEQLKAKGHHFSSTGDTAVLIAAYREWGIECVSHFIGMFAFTLLDLRENRLFCARDCFGMKPFYYTCNENLFAFASEQKALLETGYASKQVNKKLLHDYIAYGMQEGGFNSFYRNIHQLPPAHYLTVALDKSGPEAVNVKRYWNLQIKGDSTDSYEIAAQNLRKIFLQSVSIHMRSDVPIAANLSGGIDSSSIVMGMREVQKKGLDLHTISYIADYDRVSEEKWIDIVNTQSSATPHKVKPKATDLANELDRLIYLQDEPFGSTSPYAQYKVFEHINHEGLKVVLDGQGADELLAGYGSFMYSRLHSLIANKDYKKAFELFRNAKLPIRQLRIFMRGQHTLKRIKNGVHALLPLPKHNLSQQVIQQDWASTINDDYFAPKSSYDPQRTLLHTLHDKLTITGLPHLLRVADRNSMHFSVESRLPFLTPNIAEFIFTLPEEYIIDQTAMTKSVFRKAMKGITPQQVLDRRDKIGFSTPEKEWLLSLEEWFMDIFNSSFAQNNSVISANGVKEEWTNMKDGNINFDWRFWRFINTIRWMEINNITAT